MRVRHKSKLVTVAACVVASALLAPPAASGTSDRPEDSHGNAGSTAGQPRLSLIGVENPPEDIIALPRTRWVVLSAMHEQGGLSLLDRRTREETAVWPVPGFDYDPDLKAFPGCDTPPDEAHPDTHGINFVRTGPRRFDLYVVSHGGRESVEVFSLDVRRKEPKASWRGCVEVPEGVLGNSVTSLPDGGIALTKFWDSRQPLLPQLFSGEPSGSVWTWHRASGWSEVPGSDMFGPNGIEASRDGATLYVSETMKKRVVSVPTTGGPLTVVGRTRFLPDNLRWTRSGELLTTGSEFEPLTEETVAACGIPGAVSEVPDFCIPGFTVAKIDPVTRTARTVFKTRTEAYRFPTVAAQVGHQIWVGGNGIPAIAVVSKHHRPYRLHHDKTHGLN